VTVAEPVELPVKDYLDFTGKTAPIESVQLRARVGGYLQKVHYKEGDEVKKDQVLFEIDPRPFQAELDQAVAAVKSGEVRVDQTEATYQRSLRLRQSGTVGAAVSLEELEKNKQSRDVAVAALEAAKANKVVKKLNLDFTEVRSPIDGRADKEDITVGNLVSANLLDATVLTTIVTMDPMYAYFDLDEISMLRLQQLYREGKLQPAAKTLPVLLGLGNGTDYPFEGKIDFVGNQVNPSTGTVQVRGVFPNKDRALAPGLFARLRVPLGEARSALQVDEPAVGRSQGQTYLYVVNDKNEVVYRPVTVGSLHQGLREIRNGLAPGERVIINGLLRVQPGVTVDPRPGKMAADTEKKADAPTRPVEPK
jgi:RND family efflux transporter MFP subunit